MNIFNARINRISEIFMDIGQVCFASISLPFLLNKFDIIKALSGIIFSLIFWVVSVLLVKTKK
jgi:hypothetical protein